MGDVKHLREGWDAVRAFMAVHDYPESETEADVIANAKRPYVGQAHTYHGTRGATPVHGVTFRDLGDCIATALARAVKGGYANDPCCVAGNALVLLEQLMGIYPNIQPPAPAPGPAKGGE